MTSSRSRPADGISASVVVVAVLMAVRVVSSWI